MNFSRALSTFKGKGVDYAPMNWQKKMEYVKAVVLCFTPVLSWAVYQEIELNKIRNDEAYLDEILKSSEAMTSTPMGLGSGIPRAQFTKQYNERMTSEESKIKKRLEDEAYAAIK